MSTSNTISLDSLNRLEKRLGQWVWDGVLFNRDGISNPQLTILANESGERLRRILNEIAVKKPNRRKTLFTYTES